MADTYTIPLALLDYFPNVLFLAAILCLFGYFTKMKLVRLRIILLIGGLLVFIGGIMKATWKMIIAASGSDIVWLDQYLFVLQSLGFTGIFMAILLMSKSFSKQELMESKPPTAIVPMVLLATWEIPFLALQVLTCIGGQGILVYHAFKVKQKISGYLIIVAVLCTFAMSGIGSSPDLTIGMQWIAEIINTIGQSCFALGCLNLYKKY